MQHIRVLFYAATLGFFFGVALASAVTLTISDDYFGVLLAGALGVLFLYKRHTPYLVCCVAILCAVFGAFRFELSDWNQPHTLEHFENQKVQFEGVVTQEPDTREKSTHLTITVDTIEQEKTHGVVLVYDDRLSTVLYGDRVKVSGQLKKPESFDTEFGRTFKYPEYLKAQGVSEVMSFAHVAVLSSGHGVWGIGPLFSAKSRLSSAINAVLVPPESGLALGLLLGEKQALGKDLLALFRNAGLIHIVVLSGYNISILIVALLWCLSLCSLRVRSIVGALAIGLFVMMVGPSATVLRAAFMAGLVLLSHMTGRTYAILRALLISGVVILLLNPYLLAYDPGFQLSFLSTLGLILIAPSIEKWFVRIPSTFELKGFAISTLATQIMVLPILSYAIGSISVVSLVANMLVLPLVPLAMFLSGGAGFVYLLFPAAGTFVGYPAYLVLTYIVRVGSWFGSLSFAAVTVPEFSFIWVVVSYCCIGITLWYLATRVPSDKKPRLKAPMTAVHNDEDIFPF